MCMFGSTLGIILLMIQILLPNIFADAFQLGVVAVPVALPVALPVAVAATQSTWTAKPASVCAVPSIQMSHTSQTSPGFRSHEGARTSSRMLNAVQMRHLQTRQSLHSKQTLTRLFATIDDSENSENSNCSTDMDTGISRDNIGNSNDAGEERERNRKNLEADIANKLALSIAKEKVISALSKRKAGSLSQSPPLPPPPSSVSSTTSTSLPVDPQPEIPSDISQTPQRRANSNNKDKATRKSKRDFMKPSTSRSSALPSSNNHPDAKSSSPPTASSSASSSAPPSKPKTERNKSTFGGATSISNNNNNNSSSNNNKTSKPQPRTSVKTSLLPPPLANLSDDDLTSGLSSWEEFLGQSSNKNDFLSSASSSNRATTRIGSSTTTQLPNIRDLFPPNSNSADGNSMVGSSFSSNLSSSSSSLSNEFMSPIQGMDGVLPVSELFYRSSQSLSQEFFDEEDGNGNNNNNNGGGGGGGGGGNNDSNANNNNNAADDEELPFSAEQSDSLVSEDGRVHIRRNQAAIQQEEQEQDQQQPKQQQQQQQFQQRRSHSRKLVRRGMEMLVGGVAINVDPPQRSVELSYQFDQMDDDWTQVIGLNARDFGPLLHQGSAKDVTNIERGLYCESFVHSAIKWDVCPKDLLDIVKNHHVEKSSSYASLLDATSDLWEPGGGGGTSAVSTASTAASNTASKIPTFLKADQTPSTRLMRNVAATAAAAAAAAAAAGAAGGGGQIIDTNKAAQEFLEDPSMPFEYQFEIRGISNEELETITDPVLLERTILRTIVLVVQDKLLVDDFTLETNRLIVSRSLDDEAATLISIEFHFDADGEEEDIMPIAQSIKPLLTQAIDDGSFVEALAEAAAELGWFEETVDEIIADWVIVSAQGGNAKKREATKGSLSSSDPSNDNFDIPDDRTFRSEIGVGDEDAVSDLFLGGGNDGVFFDYSEANRDNAPFQGNLGPLLLDAAIERAKQRYPRVIAIGDVHGCIDELQDLLRLCDYQPGDLVCFLGDLVCKGPDSISVVQMAREIGAIGIRGNHDFEVVRWYQAIQSGVEPPVVGSEHFHIASCLSKADMKWLHALPWYISSKDLGALFVHAGFVAGIRLAKQNPRLMMNMRSILPDGTVTSKFFSNWPWARLWDGPQTVLFGHDADRGLQQYEHAIGLDTGCVYGGRLTACILPEKRLVSVNARREYFKYRRRHYD